MTGRSRYAGIPNWVGLTLTGLYLAVIWTLAAVSMWTHRLDTQALQQDNLHREVFWLARTVGLAAPGGEAAPAAAHLRMARHGSPIRRCSLVGPTGTVLASSDASCVGQPVGTDLLARLGNVGDLETVKLGPASPGPAGLYAIRLTRTTTPGATPAENLATQNASAPATAQTPGTPPAANHWLLVEAAGTPTRWFVVSWWTSVGSVVLLAVGVFWLAYRIVARALRPMIVIRQKLLGSADCLGEQLALLRVNDSMDRVATAWNRLIEFAYEMHQELRSAQIQTSIRPTLDAYRSERFAAVLRQMPHGILIVEENGRLVFANRAAARMLGKGEDDLTGRTLDEILPEPLKATVASAPPGAGRWVDHTFQNQEGSTTLRCLTLPLDKDTRAGGSVVLIQDVSQFKEMERAQDAFLYHVTHELRTPLTNIRAYAETLSDGVLDDPHALRECYNVISGETERLGRLVEAILNVSQLEVGSARLNIGEVHLDRLIRDSVQDMQAQASAKGVDLRLRLPPKLPTLSGDKERLAVVLANLIGNAIKYTPAGGQVEVTCSTATDAAGGREPDALRISVSDTGIGIDPAHHEKIFDKFYRVQDDRVEAVPGTGLGLAIVRETVRLHGGHASVESTPGRGSTFHVVLPVTPAHR